MCIAALKLLFQKQFLHFGGGCGTGRCAGREKETEAFNSEFYGDYYFYIMSVPDQWEAGTPPGLLSSLVYITQIHEIQT